MPHDSSKTDEFAAKIAAVLGFSSEAVPTKSCGSPPQPTTSLRGAALLMDAGHEEILERVSQGDPLEIGRHTAKRLTARGYLMDHMRVTRLAIGYTAYIAAREKYAGDPPLQLFLENCIDMAIAASLEEDYAIDQRSEPIRNEGNSYATAMQAEGVDPIHARRAVLKFNLQSDTLRLPLYCVLVLNQDFDSVAAHYNLSSAKLRGHLLQALRNFPTSGLNTDPIDELVADFAAGSTRLDDYILKVDQQLGVSEGQAPETYEDGDK